jgi:two-component system phosphate regulon sensor histidine kinase PhoR
MGRIIMGRIKKSIRTHRWTILFILIVLLPALSLGIITFQAFKGENQKKEYQQKQRQTQILRLLSSDLRDRFHSNSATSGGSNLSFEIHKDGIIHFTNLNTVIHRLEFPRFDPPTVDLIQWEKAQNSESSKNDLDTAKSIYLRLADSNSAFAALSRLALLRISLIMADQTGAIQWLDKIQKIDHDSVTPTGIPVQIAAALFLTRELSFTDEIAISQSDAHIYLEKILRRINRGHWELSVPQWIYYSKSIWRDIQDSVSQETDLQLIDLRIRLLESFLLISPQLKDIQMEFSTDPGLKSKTYYLPGSSAAVIVLMDQNNLAGRVIPCKDLRKTASVLLASYTSMEDYQGRISFNSSGDSLPIPDFEFLHLSFQQREYGVFRELIRGLSAYSLGVLVLLTVAALFFIYRAISHEAHVTQLKSDFVSSVSHEFRTPLSGMDALMERLESGRVQDQAMVKRYYQAIRREIGRMTQMVNGLLDFSRFEEGSSNLVFQSTDLNEVVSEVVESFINLGYKDRLQLHYEKSLNQFPVKIDKTLASQAIHNLVDNALKYSPVNQPIHLETAKFNGLVILDVVDQGPGIPVSEQRKIFEQFYRADQDGSRRKKGVGIGLSLVKQIMKEHHGEVTLKSSPGQGSRFRLAFPFE